MAWIVPFITLTLMEIVLGIDNIVFLSILLGGVAPEQRRSARIIGLGLALGARIGLLLGIRWVMGLERPLFHWSSLGVFPSAWLHNHHIDAVTGRDLVLLGGGLFLIAKSVLEIHTKVSGDDDAETDEPPKHRSYAGVLAQIVVLDLIFSLDSVISAIGMVQDVPVMVAAMVVAVIFMATFSGKVSRFIDRNPTFKMLALAFLVMIGVMLLAEGLGTHINKGYIYASMAFALVVEMLNLRTRKKKHARRGKRQSVPAA